MEQLDNAKKLIRNCFTGVRSEIALDMLIKSVEYIDEASKIIDKKPETEIPDWTVADSEGVLHIPDELDKIFNKVGMQMRFVTISGKNEVQAVAHIVYNCQKFFKEMYDKQ